MRSFAAGSRFHILKTIGAIALSVALVASFCPLVTSGILTAQAEGSAPQEMLTFEDDVLEATVSAEPGVLPEGGSLAVEEITPHDSDSVEAYADALTSLSTTLQKDDKTYAKAKVYDIQLLNADGEEAEPDGDAHVELSYKSVKQLNAQKEDLGVAHITDAGDLQLMDVDVTANKDGKAKGAAFTTDSFSYYIVFSTTTSTGSETEPSQAGNEGWLKFVTSGTQNEDWGHYASESELPALGTEDAYHRILQVNLWKLKAGKTDADAKNYTTGDDGNYEHIARNQYFWTWENKVTIDDFDLPDLEVLQTKMHTAWDAENKDEYRDSLIGTYDVRGYQSSDMTSSELNVLDVFVKDVEEESSDMRYILRYVHADGSVTDGNVRYLGNGETASINAESYKRAGEEYAGMSVVTGVDALYNGNTKDYNEQTGTGTIHYNSNVDIVKVYLYYKDAQSTNGNDDASKKGRYDRDENGYYTAETGLYTNKYAQAVPEGEQAGDLRADRQFLLNLEAWYVDKAASVGMVLDASGSMAWTSGAPVAMKLSNAQLNAISNRSSKTLGHAIGDPHADGSGNPITEDMPSTFLADDEVNAILDTSKTDNTTLGYNGYHYFLKDPRKSTDNADGSTSSGVQEYVALGYISNTTKPATNYGTLPGGAIVRWTGSAAGWYYVNSTSGNGFINNSNDAYKVGKSYDQSTGNGNSPKASQFFIDSEGYLCCTFYEGGKHMSSRVFEKRDKMFTKMETLQDSLSQFGAILIGASPDSEVAMTRFSTSELADSRLPLLNWTNDTTEIAAAMNQGKGHTMGSNRTDYDSDGANPITVYDYALTGQTKTFKGVQAFTSSGLKEYAEARDTHKYLIIFTDGKDTNKDADNARTKTDDNGLPLRTQLGTSGTQVQNYVDSGYEIITVLMRSQAMVEGSKELLDAQAYLKGLASYGKDGDPTNTTAENKLYFEADSNSAHDMVESFRAIAERIVTGLANYSVRDYIDPRFDVINEAGQVLTVLNSDGTFTAGVETDPTKDDYGLRGFTAPDGSQALLGYDEARKMFFVLWKHQDIEAAAVKATHVNPWTGQVRVQAKADFLGGNDILSNGNAYEEYDENIGGTNVREKLSYNDVYRPLANTAENLAKYNGNANAQEQIRKGLWVDVSSTDIRHDHKAFPWTSVNPGLLDVALGDYEDTVFVGENIAPGTLYDDVVATTQDTTLMRKLAREHFGEKWDAMDTAAQEATGYSSKSAYVSAHEDYFDSSYWYLEYLERIGKKLHNDKEYFTSVLEQTGLPDTATAAKFDSSLYDVTETPGYLEFTGKTDKSAAGEQVIIQKTGAKAKVQITVPYYYLEIPDDATSYAGNEPEGNDYHQKDRVGSLTYTWEIDDTAHFAGNTPGKDTKPEANDFVEFDTYIERGQQMDDTQTVRYQLSVSYTPDALTADATDHSADDVNSGNDGTARTRAIIADVTDNAERPLIRDTVADERFAVTDEQNTTDKMGWAVVHAVDGRILVEKRMTVKDYNDAKTANVASNMTFTLTGAGITADGGDEVVWNDTVAFSAMSADTSGKADDDVVTIYSHWVDSLPVGDYTLTETVTGGLRCKTVEASGDVEFMGDADPAEPYDNKAAHWAAGKSGATVHIGGTDPAHTHVNYVNSTLEYGTESASDNTVLADIEAGSTVPKNVDPAQNPTTAGAYAKDYLNAQLGRIRAVNELVKAEFTVDKWLKDIEGTEARPANAIKFSLYAAATDDDGAYVMNGTAYTKGSLVAEKTIATSGAAAGTAKFDELLGGVYILEEDKSTVDATYRGGGPWTVTIEDGQVTSFAGLDTGNGEAWDAATSTAKIVNVQKLYELPAAGGIGVFEFLFLGAFVMTLAAGITARKRRLLARPGAASRAAHSLW